MGIAIVRKWVKGNKSSYIVKYDGHKDVSFATFREAKEYCEFYGLRMFRPNLYR